MLTASLLLWVLDDDFHISSCVMVTWWDDGPPVYWSLSLRFLQYIRTCCLLNSHLTWFSVRDMFKRVEGQHIGEVSGRVWAIPLGAHVGCRSPFSRCRWVFFCLNDFRYGLRISEWPHLTPYINTLWSAETAYSVTPSYLNFLSQVLSSKTAVFNLNVKNSHLVTAITCVKLSTINCFE